MSYVDWSIGALRVGIEHGIFCLGVDGPFIHRGSDESLMDRNHYGFVLIEKIMPFGPQVGRITGMGLILMGLIVISQGLRSGYSARRDTKEE